jgi:hypothetical protein
LKDWSLLNTVLLDRGFKLYLPASELPPQVDTAPILGAMLKNLQALGCAPDAALLMRLKQSTRDQLIELEAFLMPRLARLLSTHVLYRPFYPNFPAQVMRASEAELYLNALLHYVTGWRPEQKTNPRPALLDKTVERLITLCTEEYGARVLQQLSASKVALSASDLEHLSCLIAHFGERSIDLFPKQFAFREVWACAYATLLHHKNPLACALLAQQTATAVDGLRLLAAFYQGDVSLAAPFRIGFLPRSMRRTLLDLIERSYEDTSALLEDLYRYRERFLRVAERLHPGEFSARFPRCAEAFRALANNAENPSFAARIERLWQQQPTRALQLAAMRPGEFARRMDYWLRELERKRDSESINALLQHLASIAPKLSTPLLMQLESHFKSRKCSSSEALAPNQCSSSEAVAPNKSAPVTTRLFMPKGQDARAFVRDNDLPTLSASVCEQVLTLLRQALHTRLAKLPALGACYLDDALLRYKAPFAQRSAAKSLRTLVRGSRLKLPVADTLRFFIWWKNGAQRADIDLSAVAFDSKFHYISHIAYTNLRDFGGHHSGDIVDAPDGAAEFIDISRSKMRERGVRYVLAMVNSFTQQPYCDLPECFFGWMARQHPNSGEIFDPRTLQDRIDLTSRTRTALPALMDLERGECLWLDLSVRKAPAFNDVAGNLSAATMLIQAVNNLPTTSVHDVFAHHIAARGARVASPTSAHKVFSEFAGITPFDHAEICANWL